MKIYAVRADIEADRKEIIFRLDDLTVKRDSHVFLRKFNWTVRRDEVWAILGPAGSGKTVLAEIISGRQRPAAGTVSHGFGEELPGDQRVILLSDETVLDARVDISPYYQARWNSADEETSRTVRYFLSAQGIYGSSEYQVLSASEVPGNFSKARMLAIKATGIAPLLNRKMMDLSNGELRKVLIANAIARSPSMLVFDDPLAGLDVRSQKTFGRTVRAARALGICIIFIAPELEDLPSGQVSHVLELEAGMVEYCGPLKKKVSSKIRAECSRMLVGTEVAGNGRILVDIKNASIVYGNTCVLKNVSWQIRDGEHWALTGPNGCGKTTLLSLILGDNPQAYANDVEIAGRKRGTGESIWDVKRHIGHLAPELQAFLPLDQTGLAVVCSGFFDSLGLYKRVSGKQRKTALKWIRDLGLLKLVDRLFGRMSAAEQRLIMLARALVKSPLLLILDEPCQGLDSGSKRHVRKLLDKLAQGKGISLVYVTHNPAELPECITNTLSLGRGSDRKRFARKGQKPQMAADARR